MTEFIDALQAALVARATEIVAVLFGVFVAAGAWVIRWLRAQTADSAVRQAMDAHGDTEQADYAARAELSRMQWVMRPANRHKAVAQALERERARRASSPPKGTF